MLLACSFLRIFETTSTVWIVSSPGAMVITSWDVWRLGIADFEGYPLRLQTLRLPLLLCIAVLVGKWWWPTLTGSPALSR